MWGGYLTLILRVCVGGVPYTDTERVWGGVPYTDTERVCGGGTLH